MVQVTATSDRLLRVCPIVDFVSIHTFLKRRYRVLVFSETQVRFLSRAIFRSRVSTWPPEYTQLPLATWEMVSLASQGTGPLRLLQHRIAPGVSLIVGTLMETAIDVDDIDGKEQVHSSKLLKFIARGIKDHRKPDDQTSRILAFIACLSAYQSQTSSRGLVVSLSCSKLL